MPEMAQGLAKGLHFGFVGVLLALGQFQRFQDTLHLIEGLAERFNDVIDFTDSLLNRGCRGWFPLGRFRSGKRWRQIRDRRRCFGRGSWRRRDFGMWTRRAASSSSATSSPSPSRTAAPARVMWLACAVGLFNWGFECFFRSHALCNLPSPALNATHLIFDGREATHFSTLGQRGQSGKARGKSGFAQNDQTRISNDERNTNNEMPQERARVG